MRITLKRWEAALSWLAVLSICVSYLIMFWRSDLTAWDMPGAWNAARYSCDHIWPWLSGWNHQAFAGYPQGMFYPQLMNWISCSLGRAIGLETAFRFWISLGVLLTPVSAYIFLRAIHLTKLAARMGMLSLLFFFICFRRPDDGLGGTFSGTFCGGLVSAQIAIPLFFFYLASVFRGAAKPRTLGCATILLIFLALSHGFVPLIAYLSSAVIFFTCYWPLGKKAILRYVAHVVIFLTGSAIWWVPFVIYKKEFMSGSYVNDQSFDAWAYVGVSVLFLVGVVLAVFQVRRARSKSIRVLLRLFYACTGFYIAVREFPQSMQILIGGSPFQTVRFTLFVLVFGALLVGVVVALSRRRLWMRIGAAAVAIVAVVTAGATQIPKQFELYSRTVSLPGLKQDLRGLVWTAYGNERNEPVGNFTLALSPHLLTMKLADEGYNLANGLFIESSSVAPYWMSTLMELSPWKNDFQYPFVWFSNLQSMNRVKFAEHLRYLGVQWLLSEVELTEDQKSALPIRTSKKIELILNKNEMKIPMTEYYYELDHSLAEFLKAQPVPVSSKLPWRPVSNEWWINLSGSSEVPLQSDSPLPRFSPAAATDRVVAEYVASDKIAVSIQSDESRWVYIKMPFFPYWKAHQDGTEVSLYLAGGNMMALYGRGEIMLDYERPRWEGFLYVLLGLAILLALFVTVNKNWRRGWDSNPRKV